MPHSVDDSLLENVLLMYLQDDIDFALQRYPDWMKGLFRDSSQKDIPNAIPKDASPFVQAVMSYILDHPDVKRVMGGKQTHNMKWHLCRNNLAVYLGYLEKNLPASRDFLLTCVKRYENSDADAMEGASLFHFLAMQLKSNDGIVDFQEVQQNKKLKNDGFVTYVLSICGYETHFHCWKVYRISLGNYWSESDSGTCCRQQMVPGYQNTTVPVEDYQPDNVNGVVFFFFNEDPLLDRSVDDGTKTPEVLRFIIQNFREIVMHLVVCGPVKAA